MGFLTPTPPPFEIKEWQRRPHLERIKALAQDWAVNGFGTPVAVYLLYVVKLILYVGGGLLVISATTSHLGGLGNLGDWWTEPIVFQKAVVWTMLWEILGFGAGSLPLTLRFSPMIGGVLYWLRPGTTRLPPWPDTVPLTRGTVRMPVDVGLYVAVIAWALYLLLTNGVTDTTTLAGRLDPAAVGSLLIVLVLLGLRDKVPFLAARAEVYGTLMVVFLFPLHNMIVASQIVFVCIWWGAASSKLNHHFPFVVTVMISNTPWNRSRKAKSRLYRHHPDDLIPSSTGALLAHLGTAMEFTLPLILLVSQGGTVGALAAAGMIIFHVHILSTFPLAVPLEWNLFMIFGILFLFGHYGDVPLNTLDNPLLIAFLLLAGVGLPVLGNFRPDLVSFLPSMRYYAGNWATSQWLFRKEGGSEEKLDRSIVKSAPIVRRQLEKFYEPDLVDVLLYKGLAFRSMHSHGRALNGLGPRAVDDIEDYEVREGELVAGVVLGYNFGDGHFHDRCLLEAVQDRCEFEPGELRVITLESQPAHDQRQRYRIYDAADGLLEEGWVRVADMVERQPWLDGRPFPTPTGMSEAVVVGSGPNGLACAAKLADSGVRVTVIEAASEIGGGARTSELTLPGLLHDDCSAFHPMAVGAPAVTELPLDRHGLEWAWPEVDLAHPLDGGESAAMVRSIDDTATGLGAAGAGWRRLFGRSSASFERLGEDIYLPVNHFPRHPLPLVSFGLRAALPVTALARGLRTPQARALFSGVAAHGFGVQSKPFSAAIGVAMVSACHRHGWPVARGGSGAITEAMAAVVLENGGRIETGRTVRSLGELPGADAVVLDLAPAAVAEIAGERLPPRVARAYRRYRHGPGAFKLDLAVEGGVPWADPISPRAGTVHAIGSFEEILAAERDTNRGRMPERPFVLVGQQYLADPARSRGDVHPVWSYAHVPNGYEGDASEAILDQVERFAPGLRERIVARFSRSTAELAAYDANYVGGDIITGANTPIQFLFRPRFAVDPYRTGIDGVYICSAATPPGGGAHGMGGYNAARSVLRQLRAG